MTLESLVIFAIVGFIGGVISPFLFEGMKMAYHVRKEKAKEIKND
jgi:H+/Cl- antiporter ClcA